MKRVPRLQAEPEGLAVYRTTYPEEASAGGADAGKVWDRFRDDPTYQQLRLELQAAQQGLCGYCEQRLTNSNGGLNINDQQIEHVLAKSAGVGRALDWTNLMLCCQGGTYSHHSDPTRFKKGKGNVSCGQAKEDRELAAGCDPRDFPYAPRLVDVGLDGKLTVDREACSSAGIEPDALDHTINEVLNLNCERLRLARRKVVDNIIAWLVPLTEELLKGSHWSPSEQEQLRDLMVKGRLGPDHHGHLRAFWSCERQYLEPLANAWLARNRTLLRD